MGCCRQGDSGNLEPSDRVDRGGLGKTRQVACETLLCPTPHSGHQPAAATRAADADSPAGGAQREAEEEETPSGTIQRPPGSSKARAP